MLLMRIAYQCVICSLRVNVSLVLYGTCGERIYCVFIVYLLCIYCVFTVYLL